MRKVESEVSKTYHSLDVMGLGELFELLRFEVEDAKEEGHYNELPIIKFRGKEVTCGEVLDIAKSGVNIEMDIRYIISESYELRLQFNKVRVPFYGIISFGDFMDEVEDRKIILRRVLKRIFEPMAGDVKEMEE